MKKLVMAALLVMGVSSMQAQTALESQKPFDNMYLGVEAGVATGLDLNPVFPLNANAGLKLGKNFSPVWGANIEARVGFGDNGVASSKTVVKDLSVGLNGTLNFTNLFGTYRADRTFEVIAEAGIAWQRIFGDDYLKSYQNNGDDTELLAKTGLQFAWNLGEKKAWQLYLEPQIMWNVTNGPGDAVHFNKNFAQLGLMLGLNYKFKTSNGTHNFKVYDIGAMNDEINALRNAEPKVVTKEVIKEVVKEVPVETETVNITENLVFVTFAQGKSILTKDAKAALDKIAEGRHVQIVGTCSPEGSKALNDRLSQARADVVAEYLKGRNVIVDEATGKGVQGTTSNRLAIVYVVK